MRHEQAEVTTFLATAVVGMGLLVLGRIATNQIILLGRRRRIVAHRTVVIGGGALAAELPELLDRYPQYGLSLWGSSTTARTARRSVAEYPARRGRRPRRGGATDRVRRPPGRRRRLRRAQLLDVVRRRVAPVRPAGRAAHAPVRAADRARRPHRLDPGDADPDAEPARPGAGASSARSTSSSPGSRCWSCAPLLALCALAVRIEGGPGVIFRQARVGRDGEVFDCLKFRSMRPANESESATTWSIANDDRVGPVGRFLRRTSLDELPQLWNILRGDMTLVGPRPERPHFVEQFSSRVRPLRPPAPGAGRADRPGAGQRPARGHARSPTGPASTTTTSRTGRCGSTSRSSCGPSPRFSSPAAAEVSCARTDPRRLALSVRRSSLIAPMSGVKLRLRESVEVSSQIEPPSTVGRPDAAEDPGPATAPLDVLVLGMHYAPEATGNAPYTTGMARGLAGRGHNVRVVTGFPHYPQWSIPEGYCGLRMAEQDGAVSVTRVRHPVPTVPTARRRVAMDLLFALHAAAVRGPRPGRSHRCEPGPSHRGSGTALEAAWTHGAGRRHPGPLQSSPTRNRYGIGAERAACCESGALAA